MGIIPLKMKRVRTKKAIDFTKAHRKPGYYWIRVTNGLNDRWIIAKWYDSLKFFDTMTSIREVGYRDTIIEVDENRLKRE